MSCYRNHATKVELIFLILAKWTKLFCENVLFFLKRHSHLMKKGLHNSMQPLLSLLFSLLILPESVFLLLGMLAHFQHRLTEQGP